MKNEHALLLVMLLGSAFPASAGKAPKTLVVREGLTAEQLDADGKICLAEAKAAERGQPAASQPPGATAPAQMAGAAASGFLKGSSDTDRFMAAHDACLARLGYRQVELTPEERREYGKLKDSAARGAYIVEFSRRNVATGR